MPVRQELVAARSQGLLTSAQLRRAGIGRATLSRAVARGDVLRLRRDVYAVTSLDPLPRFVVTDTGPARAYVRQVRAVLLSLGPSATACARTAAALAGWGMLVEPSRSVDVAVPHGRGRTRARGVTVHQRRRQRRNLWVALPGTDPLWMTTPAQTVFDCCLALPLLEAVVICDSALRAGAVTLAALWEAARRQPGLPHAARVRRVLALADPEAGSVLESVLRVRLRLAGLGGFTTQLTVAVGAGRTHRVDFCFEAAGLVVEVDGAKWHPEPGPDRLRDNALAAVGYRVLRYTWAEVVHDGPRVIAEIAAALQAGTRCIQLVSPVVRMAA
ncbi:MAG: type IV toxin-antitoxin system AbiEi family antitoxin domain-containing protein [Mycobacteriales bacterium]